MTSILVTDMPVDLTLEMPCNNMQRVDFRTAAATSLTGNGGKIFQTLFVDAVNFAAVGADGSLLKPFQTLQQAIDYAALQTWSAIELLIAPATYAAAVSVPDGMFVAFQGWDLSAQGPQVILGGDITVVGGVGSNGVVSFSNCQIFAANISSAVPANQDLWVTFVNCYVLAVVRGFNTTIELWNSILDGDAAPLGGILYRWDDSSWAKTISLSPVFPVASSHLYFGAGHDTYARNLTKAALAIGTTGFVSMAVPAYVHQGDRVSLQVSNPAVQDFICGVHGVLDGAVTAWITNLSRVIPDFDEPILLLVHHDQMAVEPGGP